MANVSIITTDENSRNKEYIIRNLNSQRPNPLKKIIINNHIISEEKNIELTLEVDEEKHRACLAQIDVGLHTILRDERISANLYKDVTEKIEYLCSLDYNDRINEYLENFVKKMPKKLDICVNYCENEGKQLKLYNEMNKNDFEAILESLTKLYESYCGICRRFVSVLSPLEHSNKVKNIDYTNIWQSLLKSFEKCIFRKNNNLEATTHYISSVFTNNRIKFLEENGTSIVNIIKNFEDTDVTDTLVYKMCRIVMDIGLYANYVEDAIIDSARKDYNHVSCELKEKMPIHIYIKFIQKVLEYECLLSQKYLQNKSGYLLRCVVKKSLLINFLPSILNKNLEELLRGMVKPRIKQLNFIYKTIIFCGSPIQALSQAINSQVRKIGHECASDPNNKSILITSILRLKSASDMILKRCFNNNDTISKALKDAFTHFINQQSYYIVTHLVAFLDELLTVKKKPRLTANVLDELIKKRLPMVCKTLTLMKFIHSKDHFQNTYQKYLARRLLTDAYIDIRFEKRLLKYIKTGFGAEVTHKMEGMIRDIEEKQPCYLFNADDCLDNENNIEYGFTILTKSFWPPKFSMAIILPSQMELLRQKFEDNFSLKNTHKTLKWNPIYSTVILECKKSNGNSVNVKVCLLQACILYLLNKHTSLSINNLKKRVNITNDYYLNKALISLVKFERHYSLISIFNNGLESNECDFNGRSVIRLNVCLPPNTSFINISEEFYSLIDIASGYPSDVANGNNGDDSNSSNPQEKIYQIDSSIMRIMKSVEKMNYQDLFDHTKTKLDFELTNDLFQSRIKGLISRNYLVEHDTCLDGSNGISFTYVP